MRNWKRMILISGLGVGLGVAGTAATHYVRTHEVVIATSQGASTPKASEAGFNLFKGPCLLACNIAQGACMGTCGGNPECIGKCIEVGQSCRRSC